MFAKLPVPSHGTLLAGPGHAARQRQGIISWPEAGVFAWLLMLLAVPLLVFPGLSRPALELAYVEPQSHLLIESFCGLTALVISGMILSVWLRSRNASMALFALGFLVMGVFDILHAWTNPHHDLPDFVLYHTLSTFLGGAFILAGVIVRMAVERSEGLSREDLTTLGAGLALAVGVAWLYRLFIPSLFPEGGGGFPSSVHLAHYLAGMFYVLAAIAFFRHFRERHQILALLASSLLVVFAQSAYLFSFSGMWNLAWWMWHGTKLLFYLGTMLIMFVGFLLALRTIEQSRHSLARANRSLARSQEAVQAFNRELEIRNRMVQESMLSLNLDNALDVVAKAIHQLLGLSSCELMLRMPADEWDEFDRRAPRLSSRWPLRALRDTALCNSGRCRSILPMQEVADCGYRDLSGGRSVCLQLTANGAEVGRLRLLVGDPSMELAGAEALRALAVEVGAIVHNALLYQQRREANDFRTALLRVSGIDRKSVV